MEIDGNLIELSSSDILIRTNVEELVGVPDSIALIISELGSKKNIEIGLSVDQARVIRNILNLYVEAYDAYGALLEVKTAKDESA